MFAVQNANKKEKFSISMMEITQKGRKHMKTYSRPFFHRDCTRDSLMISIITSLKHDGARAAIDNELFRNKRQQFKVQIMTVIEWAFCQNDFMIVRPLVDSNDCQKIFPRQLFSNCHITATFSHTYKLIISILSLFCGKSFSEINFKFFHLPECRKQLSSLSH